VQGFTLIEFLDDLPEKIADQIISTEAVTAEGAPVRRGETRPRRRRATARARGLRRATEKERARGAAATGRFRWPDRRRSTPPRRCSPRAGGRAPFVGTGESLAEGNAARLDGAGQRFVQERQSVTVGSQGLAQAALSRTLLGAWPRQRRKAREKAESSEKPSRKLISLSERAGSARYCSASSRRTDSRTSE